MSGGGLEAKVDALFRRYRRDAVLLHRPYPPHQGQRTNSKFGGLPRLPERYEWPRTSSGVPLHFLAQIDCAEIPFRTPLPERGVLFFFGRDDEDQVWDFDRPASDDCRVIHALDAFAATPPRDAPADLPSIGGVYSRPAWSGHLLEGEKGPAVHVEWPIRPLRIDSWLDPSALPDDADPAERGWRGFLAGVGIRTADDFDDVIERYGETLNERMAAAYAAATGEDLDLTIGGPDRDMDLAGRLLFGSAGASGPWPDRWIHVHYFARLLLNEVDRLFRGERKGELLAGSAHWLARSLDQPLFAEMEPGDSLAFRHWVESIRSAADVRPLSSDAARLVLLAAGAAIRAWAGDRALAALIPPQVYSALAGQLGGVTAWGPQYSQMLGHAPSAQEALPAEDPTICLLNLATDNALGWMFGDVGFATFWISPQDLARRDFDKVRGTIEGH